MIYLILLSEVVSDFLLYKLWRTESSMFYKAIMSIISAIPFIGPALYFFIHDMPPVQSIDKQDRMPRGG